MPRWLPQQLLLLLCLAAASTRAANGGYSAADELKNDIYIRLPREDHGVCFRLLNGTHAFGCQSSRDGNEGVLVYLRTQIEVEEAKRNDWMTRFPNYVQQTYIVMIEEKLLDGDVVRWLSQAEHIEGVIIVAPDATKERQGRGRSSLDDNDEDALSADASCPNQQTGLYSDWRACGNSESAKHWNSKGAMLDRGAMFIDWEKQLLRLTNHTTVETLSKCYDRFNGPERDANSGRLCSARLRVFSNAAASTTVCMRRQQPGMLDLDGGVHLCDPLMDKNVFAVIPPVPQKPNDKEKGTASYLAMVTRMDSFAIIPEASPGSLSSLTSVIALLTAAKVVGDNLFAFESAANSTNKRLIIGFLHGESFDYIGSSSWMEDLRHSWPVAPRDVGKERTEYVHINQLQAVLEVQQLGAGSKLYGHVDGQSYNGSKKEIDGMIGEMQQAMAHLSLHLDKQMVTEKGVLPPSSLHAILKGKRDTPVLLVSPFEKQYTEKHLNSQWDRLSAADKSTREKIKKTIEAAATALSRVAARHVGMGEEQRKALKVDERWIDMQLDCFLYSPHWRACPYFDTLLTNATHLRSQFAYKRERTTYIGADNLSLVRGLVTGLLVRATGTRNGTVNISDTKACDHLDKQQSMYWYAWQPDPWESDKNASFCWRSSVTISQAVSPVFTRKDADFSKSNYSTWTESFYSIDDIRIFLVDERPLDCTLVIVGLLMLLLSCLFIGRITESSFVIDEGEQAAEAGEPL